MKVQISGPAGNISKDLNALGKSIVTFGRQPGNDIIINSDIVSRNHGRIEKRADGNWYIVDTNSKNGIFSHGQKVTEHRLGHNSMITIEGNGQTIRMQFISEKKPVQPQGPQPVRVVNQTPAPMPDGTPLAQVQENEIASIRQDKGYGFLSGNGITGTYVSVTNKNVVVKRDRGLISKRYTTESVALSDITGVKIEENKPWVLLGVGALLVIIALILLISSSGNQAIDYSSEESLFISLISLGTAYLMKALAGQAFTYGVIILLVAYFKFRKRIIIEYAGGKIKMKFKYIDYSQVVAVRDAIVDKKDSYKKVY